MPAAGSAPGLDHAVRGQLPHRRDRHLPLRCHLINLGGCVITYGANPACQLFSEPALAVADAALYLRKPDDPSNEVLIAGSLLGALRTVREVERLADAVE